LFTQAWLKNPTNISRFEDVPAPGVNPSAKPPLGQADGRATEDCLFLDVIVPRAVYNKTCATSKGAPVMVWTFGGGNYEGNKGNSYPAGFVKRSMDNPNTAPGIVYVAMNYRLGAFGFLAGPTFTASGGTPNGAIYDQRFALEWIQKYIHLFGGDPNRVTLMGESAGAGIGMHQLTAYGGTVPAPFQQIYLASVGFSPNPYPFAQEHVYNLVLEAANVTNLAELRRLPSAALVEANNKVVFSAPYASAYFGPVVDGTLVPQLPTLLLKQGKYAKNVKNAFLSHNSDEGIIFAPPNVQNDSAFNSYVHYPFLPDAQQAVLDLVENHLYPATYNNLSGLGYDTEITRAAVMIADYFSLCHTQGLAQTFNTSHAFLFAAGEGFHGEDTSYTFYNGPALDPVTMRPINTTIAYAIQDWIIQFGCTGDPNGPGLFPVPLYGPKREMVLLSDNSTGKTVVDNAGYERCEFWNNALFY